ncbi:MAG: hypothetical protein K0A89_10890, partial [ANME-2 cluster archaeon]|nr:hypothetical protein [ANME-2 cluster archaeon]
WLPPCHPDGQRWQGKLNSPPNACFLMRFEPPTSNPPSKHPSPLRTQSPQKESKSACQHPRHKGRRSIPGGAPCISEPKGQQESHS